LTPFCTCRTEKRKKIIILPFFYLSSSAQIVHKIVHVDAPFKQPLSSHQNDCLYSGGMSPMPHHQRGRGRGGGGGFGFNGGPNRGHSPNFRGNSNFFPLRGSPNMRGAGSPHRGGGSPHRGGGSPHQQGFRGSPNFRGGRGGGGFNQRGGGGGGNHQVREKAFLSSGDS
jgi:hypothetical protein